MAPSPAHDPLVAPSAAGGACWGASISRSITVAGAVGVATLLLVASGQFTAQFPTEKSETTGGWTDLRRLFQPDLSPRLVTEMTLAQTEKIVARGGYSAPVCTAAALELVKARHADCQASMVRHLGAASRVFSYDLQTLVQTVAADAGVCSDAARDPDGKSVDNDGVPERQTITEELAAGKIPNTYQLPRASDNSPVTLPTESKLADGFDKELYLAASNPKERQHRLLCKLEQRQRKLEKSSDAAKKAHWNLEQETWKSVLQGQQAACSFSLGVNGDELHRSDLRNCLRQFSDIEAVDTLECRAKTEDTRT